MSLPWTLLRSSVAADDKPTPFHVHRELVHTLQSTHMHGTREAVEFYVEHLNDPHPHVRLKALLCMRQIALKVAPFRQLLRTSASRISPSAALALGCSSEAGSLMAQARKNLLDVLSADDASLEAKNALLASRCEGFGTRVVSFSESASAAGNPSGAAGAIINPISDFLAETVQEVADDFRSKGAVATLKDATLDVADLVVEGLEGLTGWMRQILPSPHSQLSHSGSGSLSQTAGERSVSVSASERPAATTPPVFDVAGCYRQQRGDQFAALFGEPPSSALQAQPKDEQDDTPNTTPTPTTPTPRTPELPPLLLDENGRSCLPQSFLD